MLSQQQKNHPEYCPDFQPAYKQTTHANLTVPPQRGHSDSCPGHLMILAHRVFSPAHMNPTQPHLSPSAFPITEDLDPLGSTHPYPGVYAPTHVHTQEQYLDSTNKPQWPAETTHKGPRLAQRRKARPPWGSPTEPSLLFRAVMFFCNMLPAPPPCAMFGFFRTRYVQFICSYGNMQGRRVRSDRPQLPTR